ncbi:uncharacterized protein LOC115921555 isoform X2 [Strongylocentrotus purpuratus]|uniref:Uncharacterized protein n=1 Tax=Strongylocentrotus purpuratus TaxID=7668 RepID=A0A7M7NDC9_STRPU|nr:uncharacterized protein LOC115921555 isoform X2 [Strongylocentrotus purpuratus]
MDSSPSGPVYHEISPMMLWLRRIYSGITIIMVALAMLFCLIKGKGDGTFYLLFVNLVISCVIISFLLWWYRTGDLSANKFWFIILVASVIIFQCITTDIFVFNHEQYYAPTTTAPPTAYTLVTPNKTTPTPAPPAFQNTMDSMFTQANVAAPPEG